MIFDKENMMSEDQAVTVTAASSNVIDLGNDSARVQALNEKGKLELMCQVTTLFAGGTSIVAELQSDDDVAFGSPTTVLQSAAVVTASLKAGYQFPFSELPEINEQYIRMKYTVVGTMSAGKITAALLVGKQNANRREHVSPLA